MENLGSMNLDGVNFTYTWNLTRFQLDDQRTGVRIISDFKVDDVHNMQWRMALYPKGVNDNSKDHVSIFTYLKECKKFPIEVTVSYFLLNSKGKKCNRLSRTKKFEEKGDSMSLGSYKFILTNDVIDKNYVIDGTLTIICKINVCFTQMQTLHTKTLSVIQICSNNLSKDFSKLLDNVESSDVSLNVSGKVFKAHKFILSMRSAVFAALFRHDMKESKENSVFIEETEADVFKEMLHFIYTAKVDNLDNLAFELFSLSDRYGLQDLKELCTLQLLANLDVDNSIDIYLMADRHYSNELKTEAFNFITSNIKSIIDTHKFKTLENTHPSFVAEILRSIVSKNIA